MADLEVVRQGPVAVVRLNRPSKRNAVTLAMWQGIPRVFAELGADAEIRAIVLTGAGGNFSAGADLSQFGEARGTAGQSADYELAVNAASDAIMAAPQPVIASIEGYCLGGGCNLAMACDFRFARSDAAIGIPAAKLSIVYGVRSTQRLLSLVGLSNAKRLLFTAERIDATEAAAIGFVDRVCSDPIAEAMVMGASFAALAPLTIAGAKQILNGVTMGTGTLDLQAIRNLIDRAAASADHQEGRNAFAEKRAPLFRGR